MPPVANAINSPEPSAEANINQVHADVEMEPQASAFESQKKLNNDPVVTVADVIRPPAEEVAPINAKFSCKAYV